MLVGSLMRPVRSVIFLSPSPSSGYLGLFWLKSISFFEKWFFKKEYSYHNF